MHITTRKMLYSRQNQYVIEITDNLWKDNQNINPHATNLTHINNENSKENSLTGRHVNAIYLIPEMSYYEILIFICVISSIILCIILL